jgi:hypothetical protein
MRDSSERDPDGVTVGLVEHLSMYSAGAACIAFALYYSMQPTQVANPGLAAYKPPRTVITSAVPLTLEREAITPAAVLAPEPETVGASATAAVSAPQLPEVKKAKPQAKAQRPARARPVPLQQPEHAANYAYQPSFGDYRPMY